MTAKATPEGMGYTVFPTKWIQASSVDGLPTTLKMPTLGSLRIALPPSLKASVKLSFSFYPLSSQRQDMMYSICEASRSEDPTPYVYKGHYADYPMPIDKTFVDATTSTSLLVSRSTEVRHATLVSEGSSLHLDKPSTFKSGLYRIGIGMEKDGVEEKVYLDKITEEINKGKEDMDVKCIKEADLRGRLADYEDETFDPEEWLKDHYIDHRPGFVRLWKFVFGSALLTSLQRFDTQAKKSLSTSKRDIVCNEESEEESAGGAGGIFDVDDDWHACDSSFSVAPSASHASPVRANLFTRNQTTSSHRVNTDHLTNRFTFAFAVEIVDGFDESDEDDFQTTFYNIDAKLQRNKMGMLSKIAVMDNKISTLEQQIKHKESSMKRPYENRVALISSAMTKLGQAYGEVLTRQAMKTVWVPLGMEDVVAPQKPVTIDEETNNAIEYFRDFWSKNDQLSSLFNTLVAQTFSLSTDLLKGILEETKANTVKARVPYGSKAAQCWRECQALFDEESEESAGGAGGIFDDDEDDW